MAKLYNISDKSIFLVKNRLPTWRLYFFLSYFGFGGVTAACNQLLGILHVETCPCVPCVHLPYFAPFCRHDNPIFHPEKERRQGTYI